MQQSVSAKSNPKCSVWRYGTPAMRSVFRGQIHDKLDALSSAGHCCRPLNTMWYCVYFGEFEKHATSLARYELLHKPWGEKIRARIKFMESGFKGHRRRCFSAPTSMLSVT